MPELKQQFVVRHSRPAVWAAFQDVARIASCLPGASLTSPPEGGHVEGRIAVKLGPVRANFAGEADIKLDDAAYCGVINGAGFDKNHASRARGDISFRLSEEEAGRATLVSVAISFTLSGTLAQFSRGGIVTAVADQLTKEFAANLESTLAASGTPTEVADIPRRTEELNFGMLVFSVIWNRLRSFFAALFRRA